MGKAEKTNPACPPNACRRCHNRGHGYRTCYAKCKYCGKDGRDAEGHFGLPCQLATGKVWHEWTRASYHQYGIKVTKNSELPARSSANSVFGMEVAAGTQFMPTPPMVSHQGMLSKEQVEALLSQKDQECAGLVAEKQHFLDLANKKVQELSFNNQVLAGNVKAFQEENEQLKADLESTGRALAQKQSVPVVDSSADYFFTSGWERGRAQGHAEGYSRGKDEAFAEKKELEMEAAQLRSDLDYYSTV